MSTNSGLGQLVASGSSLKPFDMKSIERELRDLWKEKSEEGKQPTMRACVQNLLIYQDNMDEIASLTETIMDVTKHHPGRVIIMSTQPNALGNQLSAGVSVICRYDPSRGKEICSEQVNIHAEGDSVKRLAATVMPLLVSDLPVTLWWRGVPMEGQPFNGLLASADRVIVDSNYSVRPTAFLSVLATMAQTRFKHVSFSDLNWARLTEVRSHLAGLFDVPDLRAYLHDLTKISIEYASNTADQDLPSPQAMLLLGWFASRMGWRVTDDVFQSKSGVHLVKFIKGEAEIMVELKPVDSMPDQDLKLTLTMTDSSGWQEARMVIMRNYAHNAIETKLESPTICWLKDVAHYEMPGEAGLLSRELEILRHDLVYEGALEMAAQVLEKM